MPNASATLRHCRREALFVAGIWLLAFGWTFGYCALYAYRADPPRVAGVPAWVAYGVACPAVACVLITLFFGLFGMSDDDLGSEGEAPGP